MSAEVLRTKMLDAPCRGCGLMVSVWRTWSGVMVCDPSWTGPGGTFHGQRHQCTNARRRAA